MGPQVGLIFYHCSFYYASVVYKS